MSPKMIDMTQDEAKAFAQHLEYLISDDAKPHAGNDFYFGMTKLWRDMLNVRTKASLDNPELFFYLRALRFVTPDDVTEDESRVLALHIREVHECEGTFSRHAEAALGLFDQVISHDSPAKAKNPEAFIAIMGKLSASIEERRASLFGIV